MPGIGKHAKRAKARPRKGGKFFTPLPDIEGRRLWSMDAIGILIKTTTRHAENGCSQTDLSFVKESKIGLKSIFTLKCGTCGETMTVSNETNDCTLPCNEAAVWAGNSTGTGYTDMAHSFACLDVPFLSKTAYLKIEEKLNKKFEHVADEVLIENGKVERRMAIELGRVDPDGQVWTELEGDGSWSRRSYNQKGRALSGSAVGFGMLSGLVLFRGVRNKYCYICCKQREGKVPEHECYMNWKGSSSEMEADIIAEGFRKSIEMHNLRYKRFLGDGDSSVFMRIRRIYFGELEKGNEYKLVQKIECKNHAIRRANTSLRSLLRQTEYPKPHVKILDSRLNDFGQFCIYAIECAKEKGLEAGVLKAAISNCAGHVFGNHEKCPAYICVSGKAVVPQKYKKDREEEEIVKSGTEYKIMNGTGLLKAIEKVFGRLANASSSLILGLTTNKSENYQCQMAKFLQGKRKNVSFRGSYNRKANLAVLSHQHGPGWYAQAYKSLQGKDPSEYWNTMHERGLRSRLRTLKRRRKRIDKNTDTKPKYFSRVVSMTDSSYGGNACRDDMDPKDLDAKIQELVVSKSINTAKEQWDLHLQTVGQFNNLKYIERRKHMLTASICGEIASLRDTTSNVGILDKILYKKFEGNNATDWGKEHEARAITAYDNETGNHVNPAGLFVSLEFGMLGASPDGLIGSDGLIEVKCPYIERFGKPVDVLNRKYGRFLRKIPGTDQLELKPNSDYFSQVVMQLHVTQRKFCDFVVWTQGPLNHEYKPLNTNGLLFIQRIERSEITLKRWEVIKDKMIRLFMEDLAPEIIDSRIERSMGYRQPKYRMEQIEKLEEIKKRSEEEAQSKVTREFEFVEVTCDLDTNEHDYAKKRRIDDCAFDDFVGIEFEVDPLPEGTVTFPIEQGISESVDAGVYGHLP